jgi:hypothetical protein
LQLKTRQSAELKFCGLFFSIGCRQKMPFVFFIGSLLALFFLFSSLFPSHFRVFLALKQLAAPQ